MVKKPRFNRSLPELKMEMNAPGEFKYDKFHLLPKEHTQQLTFNKGKVVMSVHVGSSKKQRPALSVQTQRTIEHARSSFATNLAVDNSAVKRL